MGIDRGDRIGLVGPNGAGKSTLMKIIAGVIPHDSGAVKYGHQVSVGYFAQHQYEALFNDRTALEEAQSAASGMPEQEIRSLLGAFLFSGDDVFKKVKVLSGGEKSRLALSKILLAPPNLLLMDEPTNHLDIASCEVLEQGLNNFDGTLVLITHDRRLMNAVCTGILEIEPGKAEFFPGNYEDYQYKKRLMEKEEALAAQSEPAPVRRVEAVSEGNGSRKEKKRREAESRSFLRKRTAPLRKEISVIEETLQKKESRRKEIEDLLANPEIYAQKEKILPLLEESPSLDREFKAMEAQWEELHEKLAEIENETQEA
jgi:ATP-binding cassette subfamily F protein 3